MVHHLLIPYAACPQFAAGPPRPAQALALPHLGRSCGPAQTRLARPVGQPATRRALEPAARARTGPRPGPGGHRRAASPGRPGRPCKRGHDAGHEPAWAWVTPLPLAASARDHVQHAHPALQLDAADIAGAAGQAMLALLCRRTASRCTMTHPHAGWRTASCSRPAHRVAGPRDRPRRSTPGCRACPQARSRCADCKARCRCCCTPTR
jgi:hypothetical protein